MASRLVVRRCLPKEYTGLELYLVPAASKQARTADGCVQAAQDSPEHGQQEVAVVPPADTRAQEQAVVVLQKGHHKPTNHIVAWQVIYN